MGREVEMVKSSLIANIGKVCAFAFATLLSLTLFTGCSQNEPAASDADTRTSTPNGSSAAPAVIDSPGADEAEDGIYAVSNSEEFEGLTSSSDVAAYVGKLQSETDGISASYDRENPSDVENANDLIDKLGQFNLYLSELREKGVITSEEEADFSSRTDQMLLTIDALVAS